MGLPGRQGSVRLMNFEPIFVDSQSLDFCVKGSFKIATICDSVNLDFLMTCPVSGESTIYLYPSRESLRPRYGNTTTERPIFPSGGHGETDEDIVTRNSRRGSKFVRETRYEGLLFGPTPRV